jgi:hypothetical protein
MTRRDDDIPAELREVAAQVRALGGGEWEPAAPPPLRVDDVVGAEPPGRRSRPGAGRRSQRARFAGALVLRPAAALAAAVVLLALGVAGGALLVGGGDDGAAGREVVLAPIGDGPRGAHGDARLERAAMHLTVSGLPRVAGGGFYEVWMLRDPQHLVAVGSFRVGADGRAQVDLPVAASPRRFPVLDVSREPADGDPAHSGHSVLRSKPIDS